ncbi:glutamine-hydrolyzing GMP synthase [Candidatus Parcubacteria bacterium]|nr:glutamine-hydrolyzing GMP synthase [Candidatus Parcubacteria bacterium]
MKQIQVFKGNTIVVLDFGSQLSKLIANMIRKSKVYSLIMPYDTDPSTIAALKPSGLILSGGPDSVYERNAPSLNPAYLEMGIPVLGICYGMHLMAQQLGGKVLRGKKKEYGRRELVVKESGGILLNGVEEKTVWMNHGDSITVLPSGFGVTASTKDCSVAAMEDPEKLFFTLQFHPEVEHTLDGSRIFRNFLFDACHVSGDWEMKSFLKSSIRVIRKQTNGARVIVAASGGVDSFTSVLLIKKAIGDRFDAVFVDTGLLRKNECEEVAEAFSRAGIDLTVVNAHERFLKSLKGVRDPERKRIIIGHQFIKEFGQVAKKLEKKYGEKIKFLTQGTLYPDVIESISAHGGPTAKIKSHHNVGGLPAKMGLKLIEPFREIFKDEVRVLAKILGLPKEIYGRQPSPGPGEAIRIKGPVTKRKVRILQEADFILLEELHRAGLYYNIGQAFAVLSGDRSTGQQGESRIYGNVIHIRCVDTTVYMTADWTRLPHELLDRISQRITGEIPQVNRVTYDITSKPPATIEWE